VVAEIQEVLAQPIEQIIGNNHSTMATLSASGSFVYKGVPMSIADEMFRDVENVQDDRLISIKYIRRHSPPKVGDSWIEKRAAFRGMTVSIRKTLTHLTNPGTVPFEVRLTIDVLNGPMFVPKYHGTYSICVTPHRDENDTESVTAFWTNAFAPAGCGARLTSTLFRWKLRKELDRQTLAENQNLYERALRLMVERSKPFAVREKDESPDLTEATSTSTGTRSGFLSQS
jgi:hypothetical protein